MLFLPILLGTAMANLAAPLYDELYRPQFHFTSETNWLNDPNGLVYYHGTYHLFFQHNPAGINWGNMTWGHATSPDLVHWTQHANAIEPDELGTIFSGSAVVDEKNTSGFQSGKDKPIVAIYACAGGTSPASQGKPFTQCLAYSQDAGKTWTKYSANPVIHELAHENRDPKVIWYEPKQEWVMALFLEGHTFALLSSPNLKNWTELQRIDFPDAGECPDFFEIPVAGSAQTKWILVSASGRYLVGAFDGAKFSPEQPGRLMDLGPNFYAVQTYSGIPKHDGRRIQIAWMNGGSYPGMPFNQQMSFPCALTLHPTSNGFQIHRNPVREIDSLYTKTDRWKNVSLGEGHPAVELAGDLWDLELAGEVGAAKDISLSFRGQTVHYDVAGQSLKIGDRSVPLPLHNGRFKLRALIDRSSFELFGNEGELSFSSCFLPKPEDHTAMLSASGGECKLSLTAHALHSAWKMKD